MPQHAIHETQRFNEMETPNPKKNRNSARCCFKGVVYFSFKYIAEKLANSWFTSKFSLLSKLGSSLPFLSGPFFSFHQLKSNFGRWPEGPELGQPMGVEDFLFLLPPDLAILKHQWGVTPPRNYNIPNGKFGKSSTQNRAVLVGKDVTFPSPETWQLQCYWLSFHALFRGDSMWYFLSSLYEVTLPNSTTSTIWPCRLLLITPGHWHKTNKNISVQPNVQSNKHCL